MKKGLYYKKENRLRKNNEFLRVIKRGFFLNGRFYNCYLLENNIDKIRFGIVVKKKSGSSIIRNYEKRIAREFFRISKNNLRKNIDLVFILKNNKGSFLDKKADFTDIIKCI